MKQDKNIQDEMELRSEKVRNFIGEIPSSLVTWGMVVILIIFIVMILAVCFLPYPYSKGETIIQHLLVS